MARIRECIRPKTPMAIQSALTCLSDGLNKMAARPDCFYHLYRQLIGLRFPLDVAEILELRYLLNHAIDGAEIPQETRDWREFRDAREHDLDEIAVDKPAHRARMLRLLALVRELHYQHSIASRDMETSLRRALADNLKADRQSRRYGKVALFAALSAAVAWLGLNEPGWWVKIAAGVGFYLFCDYFYALSTLKRERALLGQSLDEVLTQRVSALNWKRLARNVALTLGYARNADVEAFLIDKDVDNDTLYPSLQN